MSKSLIRQGDILLVPIAKMPLSARAVAAEQGRLILARGEATGHHHSIALSERVALFREDGSGGSGGRLFLFNNGPAPAMLEHQEHSALTIAPGTYEVRRQVEWTDEHEPRRVED